ncbi:MAG: plastocyanin/azurin family copper-binding protein [Actinomycetota bacterium]|nr:plastocyanin/azurin family copper-binding protein [Actinomycetota bacterium]
MPRFHVASALAATVVLAACSPQAPEVDPLAQIPADQRAAAVATEGGGASEGEGGGETGGATFVAVDIAWESAPQELPAGETEVEISNNGSTLHNVAFKEINDGEVIAEAPGGDSATGTVELEPGTYTYFCAVPGHEQAGMVGKLTVS